LRRRNLIYGLIALFTFLLPTLGSGAFPSAYLEQSGFRPEQIQAISLPIALLHSIALSAIAYLLDFPSADPRVVSLIGVLLMIIGALGNSFITSSWQFCAATIRMVWSDDQDGRRGVGQGGRSPTVG